MSTIIGLSCFSVLLMVSPFFWILRLLFYEDGLLILYAGLVSFRGIWVLWVRAVLFYCFLFVWSCVASF